MVTFNYTGSIQTWTVPAGVTYVFIEAFGAQGGSGGTNVGGRGGKITCTLPVTPGQVLFITVGGQSTNQTALYGFGGNGGVATSYGTFARAGGGLSGVSSANPITQANAFLIAGGGGGTPTSSFAGAGGASGGLDGLAGSSIYGGVSTRGGGASQTSGGVAGTPYDSNTILPTTGSAIFGGEEEQLVVLVLDGMAAAAAALDILVAVAVLVVEMPKVLAVVDPLGQVHLV
ncbi:hypothetical protein GHT06_007213 [Daphnia sinensis]|uniref:receptor protein-tyrosine kinase n=1 Tax=Daphnia sinensis TaxID=1820382 RepID=A0AAD5PKJ0_9CRUS|nr:hypothetical protein GHT06_007213 [Daphnia sinensis]